MSTKSVTTCQEAIELSNRGYHNGAANRAYYSLYQAIVRALVEKGKVPRDFAADLSERREENWPHYVIVENCGLAGVNGKNRHIVKTARNLRRKADYEADDVELGEISAVLKMLSTVLRELGERI